MNFPRQAHLEQVAKIILNDQVATETFKAQVAEKWNRLQIMGKPALWKDR